MALSDQEVKRLAEKAESLTKSADEAENALPYLKGALNCYDQIIHHCSDNSYYFHQRSGIKYMLFGVDITSKSYLDSAIDDINKAIGLEPDEGDYYRVRGMYRLQKIECGEKDISRKDKDIEQIIQDFKACISRDPSRPLVWLHFLALNVILRDWDEVISVYGQCKPYVNSKEHLLIRSYFGCLAFAFVGDPIEEEDIKPLHNQKIRLPWTSLIGLASSFIAKFIKKEESEEKKQEIKKINELLIIHIDSLEEKGRLLDGLLGDLEKVLVAYDKAIELEPNNVGVWNLKGNVLERLDRLEEAIVAYEKAMELQSI